MKELTISRFAKALGYGGIGLLLVLLGIWLQTGIQTAGQLAAGYARSVQLTLLFSLILLGVCVYIRLLQPSLRQPLRADLRMGMLVGAVGLVVQILLFVTYGGTEASLLSAGYTAVNAQVAFLTALPLPFLVRGAVLACSTKEDRLSRRLWAKVPVAVAAVLWIVAVACGWMMRFVLNTAA